MKRTLPVLVVLILCGLAQAEEPITIEVGVDEQALVNYHRQEMLLRRQIYRETSMGIDKRRDRYERDLEKAKSDKARLIRELAEIEAAEPVNLAELERVLKGAKAADRAIDICIEAMLIVDTAKRQFTRHRELIQKSRERIRTALGAEKGHCGLHKVALDEVLTPVVKPGEDPTAAELLHRIRNFPIPAEPFETDEAGDPRAPTGIVIPVCPQCTAARQIWLQSKKDAATP